MAAASRVVSRLCVVPLLVLSNGVVTSSSSSCNTEIPTLSTKCLRFCSSSSSEKTSLWWNKSSNKLPHIVKAGEPVLHEPARQVDPNEINSDKIQNIIDDMIHVMRKAPGVGLAAPEIGIPLRIIVLEVRKEYISYKTEEENKSQDRRPFDLLVILNPKLKKKSNKTAFFFEGCLSVGLHQALVERYLDVEVEGFDRYGEPIKIKASGWKARILQHECDHLDGTLYVDKMVPKTFRNWKNMDQPLAPGCPKLGPRA